MFLRKNHTLRWYGCLYLLHWIMAFTLSHLPKLLSRKLKPGFVLWAFFLLRLICVSINLPYGLAWNTVAMSGLVLIAATWKCQINYKNGYVGQLVLHLLPLFNPRLMVEMQPAEVFPISITLVDVHLNRLTGSSDFSTEFSVTIDRCYTDVYVNSFLLSTAKLWNSSPIE